MIWNDFHFYSVALGIQTEAYVLLPDPNVMPQQDGVPLPTLYLLHGLSDDHTMWLRQTRVEQYARKYRMAVVMPAANRSFYTDMAHGAAYFTLVSEELPRVMETYFPLSANREERFAAGLSMGGYGALKLGLTYPERYGAVASLSGPLELEKSYDPDTYQGEAFCKELDSIFGGEAALKAGEGNLSVLAQRALADGKKLPRMYLACGERDGLFGANESFVRRFGQSLPLEYRTDKAASHTWDYWDRELQCVLRWLNPPKAENVW